MGPNSRATLSRSNVISVIPVNGSPCTRSHRKEDHVFEEEDEFPYPRDNSASPREVPLNYSLEKASL